MAKNDTNVDLRKTVGAEAEIANFVNAAQRGVSGFIAASNKMFEGWAALNSEMIEFTKQRLQHQVDTSRDLASSSSITDLLALQSDFARAATEQYMKETEKIMNLGAKTVMDSLSAMSAGVPELPVGASKKQP